MSGDDARGVRAARRGSVALPIAPRRYGRIVVVGGGCYGSYYLRQLRRAARAGALSWERLLIVDHDPACRVAGELAAAGGAADATALVVRDWHGFFAEYLAAAADAEGSAGGDAIVPSPLMPHLMYRWVLARARARWPDRRIETPPLPGAPATPWQRAAPDGTHLVSFAEWTCPVNCIEPVKCPVVRGPRSWSLPSTVAAYGAAERERGGALETIVFHCTHRAYGVGMFDTSDVVAADARLRALGERGPADVVIGTVSHCHGVLNRIVVGPPPSDAA